MEYLKAWLFQAKQPNRITTIADSVMIKTLEKLIKNVDELVRENVIHYDHEKYKKTKESDLRDIIKLLRKETDIACDLLKASTIKEEPLLFNWSIERDQFIKRNTARS